MPQIVQALFVLLFSFIGSVIQPFSPTIGTEDTVWNQWRGPLRTGETPFVFPGKLDDKSMQQVWRVEMGSSYSGPIVDAKHVYVTESGPDNKEYVSALDRATGKQVWQTSWEGSMKVPFFAAANGSWIRSTPALDEGLLYIGGMVDHLVCLDAASGSRVWEINFPVEHGTSKPDFGFSSSPLVWGDSVYVQAGEAFHRIDKKSGKIIWKSLEDGGGMMGSAFSSPVVATLHGMEQLVVQTRTTLAGIDPKDGRVLWSKEIPHFRGMNILTPAVIGNSIFTSSYQNKSWRLDVQREGDQWTVTEKWAVPRPGYMSTPVVHNGHIYMHLQNQRFVCLDFESGEVKWTSEPFGKYSSLLISGDRIAALDQRGDLLLIEATPERFNLLGQARISDQETWAHLAALGDHLFIRELNAMTVWKLADQP
jgi:outer membrane protein assembly factor BamB